MRASEALAAAEQARRPRSLHSAYEATYHLRVDIAAVLVDASERERSGELVEHGWVIEDGDEHLEHLLSLVLSVLVIDARYD